MQGCSLTEYLGGVLTPASAEILRILRRERVTAAGDATVRVWDVHLEDRAPKEIHERCQRAMKVRGVGQCVTDSIGWGILR